MDNTMILAYIDIYIYIYHGGIHHIAKDIDPVSYDFVISGTDKTC
jgi:hypothetical protein